MVRSAKWALAPVVCVCVSSLAYAALPELTLTDGGARFEPFEGEVPVVRPTLDSAGAEYRINASGVQCRPDAASPWQYVARVDINSAGVAIGFDSLLRAVDDDVQYVTVRQVRELDPPYPIVGHDVVFAQFACADFYGGEDIAPVDVYPLELLDVWSVHVRPGETGVAPVSIEPFDEIYGTEETWCIANAQAVWCLDEEADAVAVRFHGDEAPGSVTANHDENRASLIHQIGPELVQNTNPDDLWRLQRPLQLPDGSVVIVARVEFYPFAVHWVGRLYPDGRDNLLLGPVARIYIPDVTRALPSHIAPPPSMVSMLGESELIYDEAWDAVWVGPVRLWGYSMVPTFDPILGGAFDYGRAGVGYRVVALDGSGSGYMDLSNATVLAKCGDDLEHWECQGQAPVDAYPVRHVPDEPFVFELTDLRGPQRLVFDRDAVDLDSDNLTRSEEDELGTSDLRADSDGDGVDDGMEALTGTDPTLAETSAPEVPVGMVASPLLAELSDGLFAEGAWRSGQHVGRGTPSCHRFAELGNFCIDADGRTLGSWDVPGFEASDAGVSVTGDVAVVRLEDGLYRLWLDGSNRFEPWLPLDTRFQERWDYPGYARTNVDNIRDIEFLAFDAEHLWVWPPNEGPRDSTGEQAARRYRLYLFDGEGNETLVFDPDAELCERGMGTCQDAYPHRAGANQGTGPHNVVSTFDVLGYHDASQRLMVGLRGNWESYVIGYHPEDDPVILQRGRAMLGSERHDPAQWSRVHRLGMWAWLVGFNTARDGGFYTPWGVIGPRFEPVPVNPWTMTWAYNKLYPLWSLRGSGTLITASSCGNAQIDPESGIEFIYAEQRVNPGDTLMLTRTSSNRANGTGWMLYAIGPRGGANALWDATLKHPDEGGTDEPDLSWLVSGIDYRESDGTLCVADRGAGELVEIAARDDGTMVPRDIVRRIADLDIIDCFYAEDDLLVLLEDPYRIEEVLPNGSLELVEDLDDVAQPLEYAVDLIEGPDQTVEVLWVSNEVDIRGYGYGTDGEPVALGPDFFGETDWPREGFVRVAARPDGRFVVANGYSTRAASDNSNGPEIFADGPLVVDRDGNAAAALFLPLVPLPDLLSTPTPIAQVPGGEPGDPWTGSERECWSVAPFDPNTVGDDVGVGGDAGLDSGGDANGGNDADGGGGEGCGCASAPTDCGGAPLLVAFALLALARRRRAHRSGRD